MRSRFLKIFIVSLSISTLLVSWCSTYVYAVDPISTGAALASALDAYGMAYGIGSVYDVSDSNGVVQSFDGLWDEFSLYQSNNGDSYNYKHFYDNFDDSPSVQAFSHSSGKFAGFYIDSESAEVFDKFWNWLLTGPAEIVKVDNAFQWNTENDQIITPTVSSYAFVNDIRIGHNDRFYIVVDNQEIEYVVNQDYSGRWYAYYTVVNGNYTFYIFSPGAGAIHGGTRFRVLPNGNWSSWSYRASGNVNYPNSSTTYYFKASVTPKETNIPLCAAVNGQSDIPSVFGNTFNPTYSDVVVKPYDIDNPVITLPDVESPDYQPTAKEIITNIPWNDNYDDTDEDENGKPIPFPPEAVAPIVDDMIDSIIDDGFAITDDPQPNPDPEPSPNEVFLPFIPVGLPSFNFSFSGIWHYVREWVSSLGAWINTLFSIWSILPYAMVVPVYATAVVVIVLGVYKRFFM